jgi:hypothetical protein
VADDELLPALGRPSSYRVEYADQAKKLCLLGFTDKEMAEFFGVCEATIYNWKNDYPAFLEATRAGKAVADAEVASSLYRRATGEHVIVEKAFKGNDGNYVTMELKTYIEPDTNAARLWLLNRRPENWRERSVTEIKGDPDSPIVHEVRRTVVDPKHTDR